MESAVALRKGDFRVRAFGTVFTLPVQTPESPSVLCVRCVVRVQELKNNTDEGLFSGGGSETDDEWTRMIRAENESRHPEIYFLGPFCNMFAMRQVIF